MIDLNDYGITMWNQDTIASFRRTLLAWYDQEKRDLPWRRTRAISYLGLRDHAPANTGRYRYSLLRAIFGLVSNGRGLACADEERLLKAWEGLGYYSRVRNMQKAAQQIMTDFGGIFPSSHADITKLKGILIQLALSQALPLICLSLRLMAMSCELWPDCLRLITILETQRTERFFRLLWRCLLIRIYRRFQSSLDGSGD